MSGQLAAAPARAQALGRSDAIDWRSLSIDLALFAVFAGALAGRTIPSLSWLCLAYLLVVPGDLLRRTIGLDVSSVAHRLVLAVPGSIAVLIAESALIEGIGKIIGTQRPFDSSAVTVGLVLSTLVLVCTARRDGAADAGPILPSTGPGTVSLAVLSPLLVVPGSSLLDNGRGPWLLIVAFVLATGLLARAFVGPRERRDGTAVIAIYSLGLSILWSFSLRTPYLYGYDINLEYAPFTTTMQAGLWAPQDGSAFNAMLSLTAIPAILTQATSLPGMTLFKIAYPMVFAVLPVAGLLIGSRFLSRGPALLAVIILCLNPAGFWQISAVARQEIALACFAGMMVVLLEPGKRTRSRTAFAAILGVACVFTHYSTSYVAIAVLLSAALLQRVVPAARRQRVSPSALPVTVPVLMLVLAIAWNVGVNHATRNLETAGGSLVASGGGLLHQANPIETWLKGTNPTPISPAGLFDLSAQEASKRAWLVPYPKAAQLDFPPETASPATTTSILPALASLDYIVFTLLRQAALLAIIVGTCLLARSQLDIQALLARFRRRRTRGPRRRLPEEPVFRVSTTLSGFFAVAASAVLVAGVMRSSTSLSLAYNPERLSTQLSLILLVPFGLVVEWLIARRNPMLRRGFVVVLALIGLLGLLDATGARGLLVGTTAGNLQAGGEHVERYAQTPTDVAAAEWLSERFVPGNQVYTDRYGALLLRSRPEFENGLLDTLTPALLDQRGYVLGTQENIVGGRARGQVQNRYSVYTFPTTFLDRYKSRVYSNGSAGVWN